MATTINTRYVDVDAAAGGDGTTANLTGGTCAFKSLSIWEAARDADLTAGDGGGNYVVERAVCGSAHANHTADTTGLFVNGFTTSANSYIDVLTDASNRAGLSWSASKYRLYVADSSALIIADDFVRVDGLQIGKSSSSANTQGCITYSSIAATNDERVSGCLLRQAGNATYTEPCVYANDPDAIVTIWNTVGYGAGSNAGTANAVFALAAAASSGCALYSCTGIGNTFGVRCGTGITAVAKNCYFRGTSAAISLGTSSALTQTNCATSDATASGTDPLDNVAYDTDTFVNVTAGSEDFHLAADGLSPLQGAGVNTSGESAPLNFTVDIEGRIRYPQTWDIGASGWLDPIDAFGLTLAEAYSQAVVGGGTEPQAGTDVLAALLAESVAISGAVATADDLAVLMAETSAVTGAVTATEAVASVLAEALSATGDTTTAEAIQSALVEALSADGTGTLADALAAWLGDAYSGTGDGQSADPTSADAVESLTGTGAASGQDAAASLLAEASTGTGAIAATDITFAALQEAMSGTATGTLLDAIVAVLVESGVAAADVVQQTSADVFALFLEEVGALTDIGHASTDETAAVLAEAASGTATVTVTDLAAAILADALSGTADILSADTFASVLAEAVALAFGLVSYASSDSLGVSLSEALTGTAAIGPADAFGGGLDEGQTGMGEASIYDLISSIVAEQGDVALTQAVTDALSAALGETFSGTATVTTLDDLPAVLAAAMTLDGAVTAADQIAAVLAESAEAALGQVSADALALVLTDSGTAAAIVPIAAYTVGTLVVTWPARKLVSQMATHTTVNRTTGWPYTLVQVAA